ncbi:MAG: lysylphosphatidylglycerol synthase domain-containing protein [Paludibaculum sp.]
MFSSAAPASLVRPYLIARAAQVSIPSQLAAWLLERIYDTLIILAIFGYALAAVVQSGQKVGQTLQWVLQTGGWFTGITCTLCMAVLIGLQRYSDGWKNVSNPH